MRFSERGACSGEILVSLCKASLQHQRLCTGVVHREGLLRCKHPVEADTRFIDGAVGPCEERAQAQSETLAWTIMVCALDQNPREFERGHAGRGENHVTASLSSFSIGSEVDIRNCERLLRRHSDVPHYGV